MPFANSVVGGSGNLVRNQIKSPNFITGSSGWIIRKDGSAEFNNIVIRNGQIVSGTALYYSSLPPVSGNLIASVSAAGGTDSAGNVYLEGVFEYKNTGAGFVAIGLEGGQLTIFTAATEAGPWTNQTTVNLSGGNDLNIQAINGNLLLSSLTAGKNIICQSTRLEVQTDIQLDVRSGVPGTPVGAGIEYCDVSGFLRYKNVSGIDAIITGDVWQSLGALGAHYTVVLGRFKMSCNNCVKLDIKVAGDGLQATSVTFANALPAAYRPATQHDSIPMGTTKQVTNGDIWPRLTVDTAGNVTVINQGTNNTFACCVDIPLD